MSSTNEGNRGGSQVDNSARDAYKLVCRLRTGTPTDVVDAARAELVALTAKLHWADDSSTPCKLVATLPEATDPADVLRWIRDWLTVATSPAALAIEGVGCRGGARRFPRIEGPASRFVRPRVVEAALGDAPRVTAPLKPEVRRAREERSRQALAAIDAAFAE